MLNRKFRITGAMGMLVVILASVLGPDFVEAIRVAIMATTPAV